MNEYSVDKRESADERGNDNDGTLGRREAMLKLAKYTAPAMLVMLSGSANANFASTLPG